MKKQVLLFILVAVMSITAVYAGDTTAQTTNSYPNMKFTGFARARYTVDLTEGKADDFSIAQARFGMTGDISKYFTYTFTIEGTNADSDNKKMIYDVYIDTTIIKNFKIRIGQFKYGFGLEQTTSDADLELVNKAEVVSNLIKPSRDIGIQVSRNFELSKVRFGLTLGLINGSGSNTADENNRKTFVGRFIITPVKGLTLGASYYDGTTGVADKKQRVGAELKFEYSKLFVKGEFIHGKDKTIKKDGFYGTIGYSIIPSTLVLFRFDNWDSNKDITDKEISRYTFGLNYFFNKSVVAQFNYEHKTEKPSVKNDVVSGQIQVKW